MNNLKPGLDRGHTLAGSLGISVEDKRRGGGGWRRGWGGLARHSLRSNSRCSRVFWTGEIRMFCPKLTITTVALQGEAGVEMAWLVDLAHRSFTLFPSVKSTQFSGCSRCQFLVQTCTWDPWTSSPKKGWGMAWPVGWPGPPEARGVPGLKTVSLSPSSAL